MTTELLRRLAEESGADLVVDVPLAELTTLRVGGVPRGHFRCSTPEQVVSVVQGLDAASIPVLILGGGSNLVVGDDPDVVVVEMADTAVRIEPLPDEDAVVVRAQAGAVWDELVARTVAEGLGGLECLSGIPGCVGATPVQNVGAYGVEVAALLRRVELYERAGRRRRWVEPSELRLGYRTSRLKNPLGPEDDAVVLAVEFTAYPDGLSAPLRYRELCAALDAREGERRPVAEVRDAVLALRSGKGMVLDASDHDTWSAGSFFTNPIVADIDAVRGRVGEHLGAEAAASMPAFPADGGTKLSAGWLIEHAGFHRGYPGESAPARLSTKHALAITNRGDATPDDIVALARGVRDGVRAAFGVVLQPEPVWIGCDL